MRAILVASLLTLAACETQAPADAVPGTYTDEGDVYVVVNGQELKETTFRTVTRRVPADKLEELKGNDQQMQEILKKIAITELLYQEAIDRKLHEDPDVQLALQVTAKEVLAGEVIDAIGDEAVTDAAIQEKYDSMALQFAKPSAELHHILVREETLANELLERLNGGADFDELAKEYSIEPGIERHGGNLGWRQRPPLRELQEAFDSAELGTVVGPVESKRGWSLMKISDRRDKTPLDEVRPRLEQMVKVEAMREYSRKLETDAEIDFPGLEGKSAPGESVEEEVTPPAGDGQDGQDGHEGHDH